MFSLASLWWIRKECLVRFLLSLWCFQVIVCTSHPFTLVAPSGMPLTTLSAVSHWKWDVRNDLFDLQLVTLQFCEAAFRPYHSCSPDRKNLPPPCWNLRKLIFKPTKRTRDISVGGMVTIWPWVDIIVGGNVGVCCPFFSVGHEWKVGTMVPRLHHRKWCLLTSLLRTSCLIIEA